MAYAENTNFATYSSHFLFSIFSPKPWSREKNKFCHIFNLFETQILPHFRTTMIWLVQDSFSMTHLFFPFSSLMTLQWWVINSWLIFFTRFSWLVVFTRENREYKMARICGKICVCCIGHHVKKSSFKHCSVAKFIHSRTWPFSLTPLTVHFRVLVSLDLTQNYHRIRLVFASRR